MFSEEICANNKLGIVTLSSAKSPAILLASENDFCKARMFLFYRAKQKYLLPSII